MNRIRFLSCFILTLIFGAVALASIFGDVRGVVRDPQNRPVNNAKVTLKSRSSDFSKTVQTNDAGEFLIRAVPVGEYSVAIEFQGFSKSEKTITVVSDSVSTLQFQMEVSPLSQQIDVTAKPGLAEVDSSSPTTLVSRKQIEMTPGADRSNSLAMITDYVPGSYVTHNQLHVRGGHQVTWLVDGVPVPNTNIADTVGPQFDPKDIDYLEAQRGGYSADYGDRTYGVFNVIPRTGFERTREGDLVMSFGNFGQTNDQISFGDHTDRLAYYFSLNGNRSSYGLQTPTADVLHDQTGGFGGFASIIYNVNATNELRFVTSLRADQYQVPNDSTDQIAGVRDIERERDAFANFSWVRTLGDGAILTVSPFYHFNRADFAGGPNDFPIIPRQNRSSNYVGAQVSIAELTRKHNLRAGVYAFYQHDSTLFGLTATDGSGLDLQQESRLSGHLAAVFAEDQYKPNTWLTLTGGIRFTHFDGTLSENVASPRVGAAIRIPRVDWVLHGFYGRYYQAPPLATVSGPLSNQVLSQGFGFLPLRGERDEEYQFGLTVPFRGWTLDTDYFHTAVKNFFDHNSLDNSNIFFPLTIDRTGSARWK